MAGILLITKVRMSTTREPKRPQASTPIAMSEDIHTLIVVDPSNDFLKQGGNFSGPEKSTECLVHKMCQLINGCRKLGYLIIWIQSFYGDQKEAENKNLFYKKYSKTWFRRATHVFQKSRPCCRRGFSGSEIHEDLRACADGDDTFFQKTSYSAFRGAKRPKRKPKLQKRNPGGPVNKEPEPANKEPELANKGKKLVDKETKSEGRPEIVKKERSELLDALRAMGVTEAYFCGASAASVYGTVLDAVEYAKDFQTYVVADCVGCSGLDEDKVALKQMEEPEKPGEPRGWKVIELGDLIPKKLKGRARGKTRCRKSGGI